LKDEDKIDSASFRGFKNGSPAMADQPDRVIA